MSSRLPGSDKSDRSALPAPGKSGLVGLAVQGWARLAPRAQKVAPGSCSSAGVGAAGRWAGVPLPHPLPGWSLSVWEAVLRK